MKFLNNLIFNYLKSHKTVFLFTLIHFISLFLEVIISSKLYIKFFDKNISKTFNSVVQMICLLWISIYILFYIGSKLETNISSNFRHYIRRELILNYLETNEVNFNDKEVEKDNLKLLDLGYFIDYCFIWLTKAFIPTIMLIVFMNLYFFIKSPILGVIQLISNIINYFIVKSYYNEILQKMLKRRESHEIMAMNLTEILANLINIYISGNMDNSIAKNDHLLNNYKDSHKEELSILYDFVNNMRTNNYIFNILSIIFLYKSSKSIKEFLDLFSIFILYIPVFKEMVKEMPEKFVYITDITIILTDLIKSKKLQDKTDIEKIYNQYTHNDITQNGNILIENISYSYDNLLVFENFSLEIKEKERVSIMAHSGRGKTTLAKLILNFIRPNKGNIFFNGININNINHRALRQKIVYINQKTILLNDTILNNLKYGNDKTDQEISYFLQKYELDKILPDLNKIVDINGKNISLGMQKIIYLIRSILRDYYVYIFDEPLTSLDKNTRSNVIKMIDENTIGKTVIIITHDTEITEITDRIINI